MRTEEQLALQAKKQKAKADAKVGAGCLHGADWRRLLTCTPPVQAALEKAKREAEAAFVPWSDAELSMLAKAIAKYPVRALPP